MIGASIIEIARGSPQMRPMANDGVLKFERAGDIAEIARDLAQRSALASLIAFLCGEIVNSFVLAKMKIWTAGRWLWTRTIGSTLFTANTLQSD